MTHHENESIIDKVKNALGMGDDEHEGHDHGPGEHDHDHDTTSTTAAAAGDVENRPTGPDYGASTSDADLESGSVADPATTGFDEPRGEAAPEQPSLIEDEQPVDAERRDPVI
ncbi:MAG: hypothetical protein ABIW50_05145 [Candidatus Limnocylindria bacterium]